MDPGHFQKMSLDPILSVQTTISDGIQDTALDLLPFPNYIFPFSSRTKNNILYKQQHIWIHELTL